MFGFPFHGYWADIGTIRAFYDANLALAQPDPLFSFDDVSGPVFTRPRFLPGSRIYDVKLDRVLLADGCVVQGAEIRSSVVGLRSLIGDDVVIRDTVLMGADYYEGQGPARPDGAPPMGIGRGCRIEGAIIDKNARIGENVRIEPFPRGIDLDERELDGARRHRRDPEGRCAATGVGDRALTRPPSRNGSRGRSRRRLRFAPGTPPAIPSGKGTTRLQPGRL